MESAESLITSMFFDPRRYDLAKVGRYKFNKKLMLRNRIAGHVAGGRRGGSHYGRGAGRGRNQADRELADRIQNAAVPYVWIQAEERNVKVLSSMMVDITNFMDVNPKEVGITELVYYPVLKKLLEEYTDPEELKELCTDPFMI